MPSQVPRVDKLSPLEVVGGQGKTVGASDLNDRRERAPGALGGLANCGAPADHTVIIIFCE